MMIKIITVGELQSPQVRASAWRPASRILPSLSMTTFFCHRPIAVRVRFTLRSLVLLVVLLVVCSRFDGLAVIAAQESTDRPDQRRALTVQLSRQPRFESAAFLAALTKGYYQQAGLEVFLREWSAGVDVAKEVSDGNADFGTFDSSLLVERANGRPVIALAALLQHSGVVVLATRQAGTLAAGDLAGQRVGSSAGSDSEVRAYLAASGVSAGSFRQFADAAEARRALVEGQVDAVAVFVGDAAVQELVAGGEYLLVAPRRTAIDFYGSVLFTSERLLASQPGMGRAFRAATLKGLDYALDHPEELVDLILAKEHRPSASREQLRFAAQQMRDLARPAGVETGAMHFARWQQALEVYRAQGAIKPDADLLGFIYDPDAAGLGPFVPWMLGGALLGVLVLGWALRRFLARKN